MGAGVWAMQEAIAGDCMDEGVRAMQGAIAGDCMDEGVRAMQGAIAGDCMDAGGRAMQEQLPSKRDYKLYEYSLPFLQVNKAELCKFVLGEFVKPVYYL